MSYERRSFLKFSRASSGTYYDEQGVLRTAQNDVPRFDHDPFTLALRGLLVEGESTNLLRYSQDFDSTQGWDNYGGNSRIRANQEIAPDGTNTANRLETLTNPYVYVYQPVSSKPGRFYTFSVFIKKETEEYFSIYFIDYFRGQTVGVLFELNSKLFSPAKSPIVSTSVIPIKDDWYRISVTISVTMDASAGSFDQIGFVHLPTRTSFLLWGAQLEEGNGPTSYIPTVASQVTRAADVPTFWDVNGLLPQNATAQENALDISVGRLGEVPIDGVRDVWNPDTCPSPLLPWLAWAFSVDEWDASWPDDVKRQTIKDAVLIQSRKGSVWAVNRAINSAGLGSATLFEGNSNAIYNGSNTYNGYVAHGNPSAWAQYRLELARPITIAQAAQVRRILELVAPARCQLVQMIYKQALNLYNGAITYNGAYSHGVV